MTQPYYVNILEDDTTASDPMAYMPEGLYSGSDLSQEAIDYLASVPNEPLPEGLSLADMQNTEYMLDRKQKAKEAHERMNNVGNSIVGRILKPYIDATLNAATSGVFGAAKTGLQGGNWEDVAKSYALSQAGNVIGDRVATGLEYGVNPFSEQAGMLASQTGNMGVYGFLPTAAGGAASRLVEGKSVEDALIGGLAQGVREGDFSSGMSLDIKTPEFLREFDKAVIRPTGEALSEFDKSVLQPVTRPVYGAVKDVGKAIDDVIIDPIDQALRDINLPDVSLPEVNMPKLNLKGLFSGLVSPSFLDAVSPTTTKEEEDYKLDKNPYRRVTKPSIGLFNRQTV